MKRSTLAVGALFVLSALLGAAFGRQNQARANEISRSFSPFAPAVKVRSDEKNFFVESNGMPDHPLMVGITAWQQQVPLPQSYFGNNAWQFPLYPRPAQEIKSARTGFFRGAIAVAANGVPIFNPIKNDGRTDTFLAGELDNFGGHSGRGDDYHYHLAPTFLESKIGKGLPVAYALDGYPIYGLNEPDGRPPVGLDEINGHSTAGLGYHYHATKNYPYLNGGFHGEVIERGGQVDPQPRAFSPRPATSPLRGARITDFKTLEPGRSYSLTYRLDGQESRIDYQVAKNGQVVFNFVDPSGNSRQETYQGQPSRRGGGQRQGPGRKDEQLGPPPGPRKPWLVDHAKALDTNEDGVVEWSEVAKQCKDAFDGYAEGKSTISVASLPDLPTVRNEVGGFVKVHAKEIDKNEDGQITREEIEAVMRKMFDKQDRDRNGKLTSEELAG